MALWGNNDNVFSGGTVSLDYATRIVTGAGTTFGQAGAAKTGDIIRFGIRDGVGTYYGDAVIVGIASTTQLTIGSTSGLSGAAIASTDFYVSELPSYTVGDSKYSEASYGTDDSLVYGVGRTVTGQYAPAHQGWVGVTTYVDQHGRLRVKSEVLVAMSGIQTGANGISYPTNQ